MNIKLHIQRLVLHGVELTPIEQRRLKLSIESEMVRLIDQAGFEDAMVRAHDVTALHGPAMDLPSPQDASRLGRQIARSVHGGLIQ